MYSYMYIFYTIQNFILFKNIISMSIFMLSKYKNTEAVGYSTVGVEWKKMILTMQGRLLEGDQ